MAKNPDLRSFIQDVKEKIPDLFLSVPQTVPADYVATALVMQLELQKKSPILYFQSIQGHTQPLITNLFASRELLAFSAGTQPENFYEKFGCCLDNPLPPQIVATGPVQEHVWIGDQADVTRFPVPIHFALDAGPYITAGMTAAADPETGCGNLSFIRLQIKGPRLMGASLHSRQHLWDYFRRSELLGRDLPICVVIGGHPALMIAAAAKMGIDQDEYTLAGALLGEPIPICRAKTVDVYVPANAEMVIEGYIKANARQPEGPFGEYTGYSTDRSTQNVVEITAITTRKDPIFVDLIPGNSQEHLILGRASKEAWVYKRMREAYPFFDTFYYPSSGTHFHCYLKIHKSAEGQARQAAMLLLGLDHYVKLVVVVDDDIDLSDEQKVLWCVAMCVQADRDVSVISDVLCNQLDPSSDGGVGAKMIIDATRPLNSTAKSISLPPEAMRTAQNILDGLEK
jgi:2,5-furandicarboxylate decarboxylase 1